MMHKYAKPKNIINIIYLLMRIRKFYWFIIYFQLFKNSKSLSPIKFNVFFNNFITNYLNKCLFSKCESKIFLRLNQINKISTFMNLFNTQRIKLNDYLYPFNYNTWPSKIFIIVIILGITKGIYIAPLFKLVAK